MKQAVCMHSWCVVDQTSICQGSGMCKSASSVLKTNTISLCQSVRASLQIGICMNFLLIDLLAIFAATLSKQIWLVWDLAETQIDCSIASHIMSMIRRDSWLEALDCGRTIQCLSSNTWQKNMFMPFLWLLAWGTLPWQQGTASEQQGFQNWLSARSNHLQKRPSCRASSYCFAKHLGINASQMGRLIQCPFPV